MSLSEYTVGQGLLGAGKDQTKAAYEHIDTAVDREWCGGIGFSQLLTRGEGNSEGS